MKRANVARASRLLFPIALLAAAAGALDAQARREPWTPRPELRRPERPLPPATGVTGAEPFVPAPIAVTGDAPAIPGGPLLAEAGSDPVLRGQLEPAMANQLTFSKVPGGVVFGMPARFESDTAGETWTGAAFERGADGWVLRDAAGRALALPQEDPSFLSAALAFARDGVHGDWLADLGVGGEVHLAPALVDTTAGMAAVRADLVPLFHLHVPVGAKSIIVDRDVRVLVDGSRLRLEADLEVRFYRPQRTPGGPDLADRVGTIPLTCVAGETDGRPDLFGPEGPEIALMATRLERAAALAGWIGFFRSALAAEVEGIDALGRDLAAAAGSSHVRTPRRIDRADLAAWVSGAMVRPPGEVPDWMREYAERKRAGASR